MKDNLRLALVNIMFIDLLIQYNLLLQKNNCVHQAKHKDYSLSIDNNLINNIMQNTK